MGRTKVKFRRQKHTERQIQDQLEKERQINPSMELPASLTVTQRDQIMVEQRVFQIYQIFSELPHSSKSFMMELQRDSHVEYLTKGLRGLNSSFSCLDANRPWLCYWILHSLALLDEPVDDDLENSSIDFLRRCQDPNGGYGGGPGQMPHLATTYAAVNALISVGGEGAFSSVNRDSIYSFLRRMKQSNGGFRMHDGGEVDVRACYTAISVASILNVLDYELIRNVGDYILSCQTHEGGISGEPGSEAHGGYTYCGVAAMILINEVDRLDLLGLLDWVVFRQGIECGFQGRTNKLVDGCYSFWQGGVCTILQRLLPIINRQLGITEVEDDSTTDATLVSSDEEDDLGSGSVRVEEACQFKNGGSQHVSSSASLLSNTGHKFLDLPSKIAPLFNSIALQQYIILCSQLPEGGFRDKPGKGRDFYHTCYCLSGLSVCQYSGSIEVDSTPSQRDVLGPYLNLVEPIHPVYNVVLSKYQEAFEFFHGSKVA